MSYRPQLKTENGVNDLPLDAETIKGVDIIDSNNKIKESVLPSHDASLAKLIWNSSTTYSANDVCIYNGKLYVSAVNSNTGHTPSSSADTSYWVRMFV